MSAPLDGGVVQRKNCKHCGKSFGPEDLPWGNFKRQKMCGRACMHAAKKFTPEQAQAAFWSRVDKTGDCWLYTGARDKLGYGDCGYMGKHIQAHRLAWKLTRRDPGKLHVLHKCNNPPCCNPMHLYVGDDFDNAADRVRAGTVVRGAAMYNARLDDDKVKTIRERRKATGESYARIAKDYGVCHSTVRYICRGETWAHIK